MANRPAMPSRQNRKSAALIPMPIAGSGPSGCVPGERRNPPGTGPQDLIVKFQEVVPLGPLAKLVGFARVRAECAGLLGTAEGRRQVEWGSTVV